MVETLRYKRTGRGFDARRCHWIIHWLNPAGRTMDLESIQPLIEVSTRDVFLGGKDGRCHLNSVQDGLALENGADMMSRNASK